MTNKETKDLLDRYIKGECSPGERALVEAWFEEQPQAKLRVDELQQIGADVKFAIDQSTGHPKVRTINYKIWWAAASVLLLGFCYLLLHRSLKPQAIVYTQTTVPAGERVKLVLSDSSVVIVNGSSKLEYPETFDGKIREVTLVEGEAYFDVKHDASRPFIVRAKGTQINVLGTAFNVRAYKFLKNVQVTVTRGKVSVSRPHNPVVTLLPDEQVTVDAAPVMLKKHIRSDDYIGWVQGKYRFDNETLGNVASALESYYKIQITFSEESIRDIRFSSEFDSNDKLEDLLYDICKANNLSYSEKDQLIIISKNLKK